MKNYRVTFGAGKEAVILHKEYCNSFADFAADHKDFDFTEVTKIETYEFTTSSIQKALTSREFSNNSTVESYIIDRATQLGYVRRNSHTQAEWVSEKALEMASLCLDHRSEKREAHYIAYNMDTYEIVATSKFYSGEIHEIQGRKGYHYINVTHPKAKEILLKINKVNNTNYF